MIVVKFKKNYSKTYNINFNGKVLVKIFYDNNMKLNKIISYKKSGINIPTKENLLDKINQFRKENKIKTDDVITVVDMYFANEFSKEYIGKGILN